MRNNKDIDIIHILYKKFLLPEIVYRCPLCAALVCNDDLLLHTNWHNKIDNRKIYLGIGE